MTDPTDSATPALTVADLRGMGHRHPALRRRTVHVNDTTEHMLRLYLVPQIADEGDRLYGMRVLRAPELPTGTLEVRQGDAVIARVVGIWWGRRP